MKTVKIGLLTDNYPYSGGAGSSPPGGIGTYSQLVAEELVRQGHDVHVFAFADVLRLRCVSHNGVKLWQCPVWSHRRQMGIGQAIEFSVRHRASAWKLGRFSLAVAVRQAAKDRVFDVIETPEFGALGDCINRKHSHRWAVRLHLPSSVKRRKGGTVSAEWTPIELDERRILSLADVVTAPTLACVELIETVWGQINSDVKIVGNPARAVLPVQDVRQPNTVLFVGRLEHTKGVDVLARSARAISKECPSATISFIGPDVRWEDGRLGSEVIRSILPSTADDDRYRIEGVVDHSTAMQRMRESTVCVLPSRFETFGMTLLESMMCGTPAVAADIGAFAELSERGRYAHLHKTEDPDHLAECTCRLLRSQALCEELGAAARLHAMKWAPEKVVPQLLDAWFG